MNYSEELDRCENFGDVFELVKKSVKDSLGQWRAGLMLYLADLPMYIGAFHGVGSNAIVMNRRLLDLTVKSSRSRREINSYVFYILLHEYLHSLGYIEEDKVRRLVHAVAERTFGEEHPATQMAVTGPAAILSRIHRPVEEPSGSDVEIVRDFDRSNQTYFS